MRVLIFDTETNGLPAAYNVPYTVVENWPRIIQIAWQVWDVEAGVCLLRATVLVKPDPTMIWNAEAAQINGHTFPVVKKEGLPIHRVLGWFLSDAKEVDLIVAHNLKFDKAVLGAECLRLVNKGHAQFDLSEWWPRHELCSMLETVNFCKIPSKSEWKKKDDYKWPKLAELFQHLFPGEALPDNLHDAGEDVACLVRCFRELVKRRVLPLPDLRAVERPGDRFVKLFREVLKLLV
jgi:DNA polymerase III epsilon subunit-like protein